jgi:uncharacterized peroxidase-related enzyme
MSDFTIHTMETAPAASKDVLAAVQKKFGFIPNLMGELADVPAALRAYATLGELLGQTSLSPIEQQIVLAAVSVANGCEYCVAAHSAGLKAAGLPQEQLDALLGGRPLADQRLQALREFTTAIVEDRGWIKQHQLQRFLDVGYRREQLFEVLVGVAMKTLSNYANHIAGTPLDSQLQAFAWEPTTA